MHSFSKKKQKTNKNKNKKNGQFQIMETMTSSIQELHVHI